MNTEDPSHISNILPDADAWEQFKNQCKAWQLRTGRTDEVIEAERAAQALEDHKWKVHFLREAWDAPKRHASVKVEDKPGWSAARDNVTKMALGDNGACMALVGARGNGKTQLAVEVMRAVTGVEKTALYTTATGFGLELVSTFDKAGVLEKYAKPYLLVVDEFGKRAASENGSVFLFELLNRRYSDTKPTILIDNLDPKEFSKSVGASLARRINETGGIVNCDW